MIQKLKQKRGETLVETLFAMLIAVLSMGILCTAVMAATSLNNQTREMDEKYRSELQEVEGWNGTTNSKLLYITFKSKDGSRVMEVVDDVTVQVYGGADSVFLSYDYTPTNIPEEDMP